MLQGKTLQQLAAEIERQNSAKQDFLIDTRELSMVPSAKGGELLCVGKDNLPIAVNEIAHGQIGEKMGIPTKYYNRLLKDHPDMLAYNVNELFQREPEKRMVRTMDGKARAFLSSRYRRIDNMEVAEAVLPIIGDMKDASVESCELTEKKCTLKF
jgi:hypothetical protein